MTSWWWNITILNSHALLLHRFKDIVGRNTSPAAGTFYFPETLGGFSFQKTVVIAKPVNLYQFAIYTGKNGDRYFAKAWFGKRRNTAYYWLKHEAAVYAANEQILTDNPASMAQMSMRLPRLATVSEAANHLIILMEWLPLVPTHPTAATLSLRYTEALTLVRILDQQAGDALRRQLYAVTPLMIIGSMLLVSLVAVLRKPPLWKEIALSVGYWVAYGWQLWQLPWQRLVHRDLEGSVLTTGNDYYLIDWQTAVFATPLLELSQLALAHWSHTSFEFNPLTLPEAVDLLKSRRSLTCFKLLSLYVVLIEISLVRTKTTTEEQTFMRYMLGLTRV